MMRLDAIPAEDEACTMCCLSGKKGPVLRSEGETGEIRDGWQGGERDEGEGQGLKGGEQDEGDGRPG